MDTSRQMLPFIALATFAWAQSSVTWQQAGGSFQSTPTLKGIVSQGYETPVATTASGELRSGFLAHPLLLNQGPFVSSPLADQVLHLGSTATTLDLSGAFTSWEGNALAYSVSGGAGTVSAQVSGSTLSLTGQASGTSRLIVVATDGTLSVEDTFQVVVEGSTAIAPPPVSRAGSGTLAANITRPMAAAAQGRAAPSLDVGGNCPEEACLSLGISLPGPASVRVSIFDNLGTPVISWNRDFAAWDLNRMPGGSRGGATAMLSWNLRAADGTPVAPGVYLWKIEATTPDGQKLETVKRTGVK